MLEFEFGADQSALVIFYFIILGFGGHIKKLRHNLKVEDLEKFMLSKLKFKKMNRMMKVKFSSTFFRKMSHIND